MGQSPVTISLADIQQLLAENARLKAQGMAGPDMRNFGLSLDVPAEEAGAPIPLEPYAPYDPAAGDVPDPAPSTGQPFSFRALLDAVQQQFQQQRQSGQGFNLPALAGAGGDYLKSASLFPSGQPPVLGPEPAPATFRDEPGRYLGARAGEFAKGALWTDPSDVGLDIATGGHAYDDLPMAELMGMAATAIPKEALGAVVKGAKAARTGISHAVRAAMKTGNAAHEIAKQLYLERGYVQPMGGEHPEVLRVMGGSDSAMTGISGSHAVFRDAVTDAAGRYGLRPNQAQSVSWESIKGLFSARQRSNTKFIAQIKGLWDDYADGNMTLGDLHDAIFDAALSGRQFDLPEWSKFPRPEQGGTP